VKNKVMVWGYLIILSFATMLNLYMPKTEAAAKESIVIPGQAIRLRILANSDYEKDQAIKRKVRDAVNAHITLWVQDLTSMEKARTVIKSKLPEIQEIAEKTVREQGSNQSVKVEFDKVQFPTKLYGQYLYPAGKYQAVLITLGEGKGANWWCVLYPPLCFLDFSNGLAVSKGFEEKKTKAKAEEKAVKAEQAPDAAKSVQDTHKAAETAAKPQHVDKAAEQPASEDSNDAVTNTKEQAAAKVEEESDTKEQAVKKDSQVTVEKESNTNEQAPRNNSQVTVEKEVNTNEQARQSNSQVTAEQEHVTTEQPAKKDVEKDSTGAVNKTTADVPQAEKEDTKVYVSEDEQPVKVKFFVVELWQKLFN